MSACAQEPCKARTIHMNAAHHRRPSTRSEEVDLGTYHAGGEATPVGDTHRALAGSDRQGECTCSRMLSNTCRYAWMRIGVLCATFRARRLHAGQVHELLRQDDTLVCDCHANLKQLCRLSFCSDGCSSLEPNERRHHGWPHAKRLRPSVHSCDEERLRCSLLCGRVSFSIL